MQTQDTTKVETYRLVAMNGRHIRQATKVTMPNGEVIRFTEKLSKREAIRQATIQQQLSGDRAWSAGFTAGRFCTGCHPSGVAVESSAHTLRYLAGYVSGAEIAKVERPEEYEAAFTR
jgi:hypothetical protein